MAKTKSATSLRSMLLFSLVASAFVAAISYGSFDELFRVVIAAAITFVVVFIGLVVLKWAAKDDNVNPGEPRLK